jgi:hypothetical protein
MRVAITLLTLPLAIWGQVSSNISLSNGIRLRIVTNSGNGVPGPLKTELKAATGNSVYRIFRDETGLAVYAYELVVDRLPDGIHFQVIAKPAGDEFAAKFPDADGGKPAPTMSRPIESSPLNPGGRFTIDIPTNPGLFERRTDTVEVQPAERADGSTASPGTPVAPAPLLRFAGLKVSINGQPVPIHNPGAVVAGQFAMFYIPRRGGYFFSTQPVDLRPFLQAGIVDRTQLKFTIDNETYECNAEAPILPQSDRGQIWVYRDRKYKPSGTWTKNNPNSRAPDEFFTAASDSLNWWLP